MRRFLLAVFTAAALAVSLPLMAQSGKIVIERTGKQSNPTLAFQGISGNQALSELVRENLIKCGWFDVKMGGATDYLVSGTAEGGKATISLKNGAGLVITSFSISGGNTDQMAASAVDTILQHEFKIPGICRSKIVFCVETVPGKQREIYTCDFNGHNITRLTDNKSLSVEPAWTPDGKSIVYCYYGMSSTSLIQYRFDIQKSRRLTRYKGLNAGGALSPDGKYVALVLNLDNQVDLYIRPTEGGKLIRLTKDKAVEASPAWTPDGKKICYVSDTVGRPQLFMLDPFRRSAAARIPGLSGSERVTPDFAANGNLAYSAKTGGDYVIAVVDMSNPSSPKLDKIGNADTPDVPGEGPSWAPDSRHVVAADKGKLFVLDTWFGKKRLLVSGSSRMFQPDWSPILP